MLLRDSWHPVNLLVRLVAASPLLLLLSSPFLLAQDQPIDLTKVSIETLMNMEVSSVAKKDQKLSQSAAAIFVITQEDIRRSGMTSIAELLRMVPGMDVAHIDANKWAISSRGFNEQFADKLVVLIDGRAVYTPLFAGVYWDTQDTLLEDIDRIEVIRGPGATLWGANAGNGVINVITKGARETQGGLAIAGAGMQEPGFGAVRYGGRVGRRGHYRIFGKYFDGTPFADSAGKNSRDDWTVQRGGFRTDWNITGRDTLTVQGDYYNGAAGITIPGAFSLSGPKSQFVNDRMHLAGGDVLGRWKHQFSDRSDTTIQVYYDRAKRRDNLLGEARRTVDFDFDHHVAIGSRHDILWGLGYRSTSDQTRGSLTFSFNPPSRNNNLTSGFFHYEVALLKDRFWLTLGTKLERNVYTGFEVDPNIRLLWVPYKNHSVWAAVSRAAEAPSRFEADGRINQDASAFPVGKGLPIIVSIFGNPYIPAETLLAREIGYRAQLSKRFSFDLATFYNSYYKLHTEEPGVPFLEVNPPPRHLIVPISIASKLSGETHGFEAEANWNVTDYWTLRTGYSLLQMHMHVAPSSRHQSAGREIEGESPNQQFHVRSQLNLPHKLELDTALYYVSRLPNLRVSEYLRLDARLGWRPAGSWEISLVGQDLTSPRHFEFGSNFVSATQVKRTVYGKVLWRF